MNDPAALTALSKVKHVFVIDDDAFMLELMGEMLLDLGIKKISTAVDGAHGLKMFESASPPPDILICDLNMPNWDGFQLMESFSGKKFACGLILISGMSLKFINSAALMARFHNLNVLGTLHKPFDKPSLAALISKMHPIS